MTPVKEAPSLDLTFSHITDGLRILLVEDNSDQHYLVERFLRGSYASLFWAKSSEEALEMIEQEEFDLFVLDVMLPKMDGWELFSEIRKIPGHLRTPVLFLTCVVPPSEENLASDDHGYCRTLAKPSSKEGFRNAIINLLRG
ncbi:response regulator [Puniceicoccus vermicola]|uniref:Response regulator n=1 Tax=Puniceicoccus vermicola TaxID=388746 RepID=A0A7X1AYG8_9BACT|nr:response regulator [Puniceicoccus vermicola]MBC2602321.1 response regulator [Puniceicoccus vermicola]